AIEERIPSPVFDPSHDPMMYVARSFDVNKPGTNPAKLVGGVLGGSLVTGELRVGQEIEISPGIQVTKGNKQTWENVITEITSLRAGTSSLDKIRPGGLAAVGTKLDPFLTKNDSFTGRIVGNVGKAPPVVSDAVVVTHLLKRVVGFAEEQIITPIKSKESLMLTVGTANTVAVVSSGRDDEIEVSLRYPVAANVGARVAIGRRISNRWRLIGYGELKSIA
ncbi:translation initiation factor IF-2 subunit gamma, partial [mine drainage metagenome]